jgi:signal transduction histidine kinase
VQIVEVSADGRILDSSHAARLHPDTERIQIRYTAIHLTAPERIQYSHKLEGLDRDWVPAGNQRLINYNSLPHGTYRFRVRAQLPEALVSEKFFDFEVEPQFYETLWFRLLSVGLLGVAVVTAYQMRLRRYRYGVALVLEERMRMARELHDTVAQSLVGISAQLDALETCLPEKARRAHIYLDLARRMARHSLTEARRSVRDLRALALDKEDLLIALRTGIPAWVAGSNVEVKIDVPNDRIKLPEDTGQHLLRIAQEAVTNALRHADAKTIWLSLHVEPGQLRLKVADDGCGFDPEDAFVSMGGHFGLIGMRERAERVGGELRLDSQAGKGTQVEVILPLS